MDDFDEKSLRDAKESRYYKRVWHGLNMASQSDLRNETGLIEILVDLYAEIDMLKIKLRHLKGEYDI